MPILFLSDLHDLGWWHIFGETLTGLDPRLRCGRLRELRSLHHLMNSFIQAQWLVSSGWDHNPQIQGVPLTASPCLVDPKDGEAAGQVKL